MGMKTICFKWCYNTMNPTKLMFRQMFGYSLWECKAYPLYLQEKLDDVYYTYEYILGISNYIQMQKYNRKTLKYEDIETDMDLFEKMPTKFEIPKLYNRVSYITEAEKQKRRKEGVDTFYIHDMITCDDTIEIGPGGDVQVEIKDCPGITQTIFFMLENVAYYAYNNTHNYTSSKDETDESQTGIISTSIITSAGEKVSQLPSQLLETQIAMDTYRNNGPKIGILSMPGVAVVTRKNNGGLCADLIKMIIKCKSSKEVHGKEISPRYRFRVRVLVSKEYTFINGKLSISEINKH